MVNPAIKIDNLSYTYNANTSFAFSALNNISVTIPAHQVTAIVGHTGSGKSTLMQLVDGLLKPTTGSIDVHGTVVNAQSSKAAFTKLRQHVGFVFQFPENQLFADTVLQDVMFGPLNLGMDEKSAKQNAIQALERLEFPKELYDLSPFELSGGQMRRVAIAGVLAMDPDILILDEPTAGLDPHGAAELMQLVQQLRSEGTTILLITHQMEQVAEYADQVIALRKGQVVFTGTPRELFNDTNQLHQIGLAAPATIDFVHRLNAKRLTLANMPLDMDTLADELANVLQKGMEKHG